MVLPSRCCWPVDDATGIVVNALFCEQENTRDYFLLMMGLIQHHGIPIALYTERGLAGGLAPNLPAMSLR